MSDRFKSFQKNLLSWGLSKRTIGVIVLLLSVLLATTPTFARDSIYTQKGSGPMYWTTYEYESSNGAYMPESRWKANIDWLNSDLKSYGYNMVCTDGWGVLGSTRHNSNGYVLSYDDHWANDWTYWATYLSNNNMKLGVYYNPLWVHSAIRSDPNAKITGTNYTVGSLTNANDVFQYTSNANLYWVDVTRPGAEQYIKGYVNYFKNCGVKYLRVDWLQWYEDGKYWDINGNIQTNGVVHGAANYETAIRWMKEACGDDIELSLVMPGLKNHGLTEVKYGDMIRMSDDSYCRGWPFVSSSRRGVWQQDVPQLGNSFDGFVYYADLNDKGKIILDGDFLTMHNFANDEERKFAVSLFAMAGSPITICDEYDTIGSNDWVYKNSEINSLNSDGFAGKPFVFNMNDVNSQKWKGQLSNGDWVVGLFNREDTAQTRSVNFAADLNMSGNGSVRDLWSHTNLGSMSSYSISLAAHSCKILKISGTTNDYTVKELEFGKMLGGAYTYVDTAGASNTNGVGYLGAAGSGVEVKKIAAGSQMTVRYASGQASNVTLSLYVNGSHNQDITFAPTGGWTGAGKYADKVVNVNIPAGATLKFQVDSGDGAVNLDKVIVGITSPPISIGTNYVMTFKNSNKTASVDSGSTANGAYTIQWAWVNSNAQRWTAEDAGGGYYKFKNVNSGKYLGVENSYITNGSRIVQWDWVNADAQKWQLIDDGGGYFRVFNKNANKVLSVDSSSTSDGASIIIWDWVSADSQRIKFEAK